MVYLGLNHVIEAYFLPLIGIVDCLQLFNVCGVGFGMLTCILALSLEAFYDLLNLVNVVLLI